jgi:hypothetical protein
MQESEGQNGQMTLKKSRGSLMNRLMSCFNAENIQNALLGLILIVKTSGSTEMIIQYPSVKTRYNSIHFCKVIPSFYSQHIKYYYKIFFLKKKKKPKNFSYGRVLVALWRWCSRVSTMV